MVLNLGCSDSAPSASEARQASGESVSAPAFPDGTPKQRPEFEAIAQRLYRTGATDFFPKRLVNELKAKLDTNLTLHQRIETSAEYARALLNQGDTQAAVDAIEHSFALASQVPGGLEQMPGYHWLRGLVYLRQAEVQNCIKRRNRDCCVFPLQGGGVHEVKDAAEQSLLSYLKFASIKAPQLHGASDLAARWMMNILAMALGHYPDRVPQDIRVPPEAFASKYDIKRFVDIGQSLGVDAFDLAGGCIAADFDGDGLLDIASSTLDIEGPMHLFRNDGKGGFEDRSEASRLTDQLGGLNCVGADYDNDGDIDILVLRGAWWFEDGRIRKSLLRNDGRGVFSDVTRQAGLADPAMPTQVGVWFDYDNDGDLDLFVGNESRVGLGEPKGNYPSQLYRNNGDGTFTDVARQAGVANDRYAKGASAGDYDNDGDVDLYVSNLEENRLYRNNGNGTFGDVAVQLGVVEPKGRSFATWFFDYNNDGWLDIFCASYEASIADLCADYLGQSHQALLPVLYRNDGGERFVDVTREMGLAHPYLPMGANFGDLDNDGWLDIYLGTGAPGYDTLMPNIMLRNHAGKGFQDVTTSGGFGYLQKGHGIAFADFDHDGDQDIYHQLGGLFPGDAFHNVFLLNPGHGNGFITLLLQGVNSNRMGYGARLKLALQTPDGQREIHRAAGSVSSFGGSTSRLEIGLGDATAISRLEIKWPSGAMQTFENLPLNCFLRIVEDRAEFERLEMAPIQLKR